MLRHFLRSACSSYVCVCVYIYIYIYTHTSCIHIHTHTSYLHSLCVDPIIKHLSQVCQLFIYIYIYIYIHTHTHTHILPAQSVC